MGDTEYGYFKDAVIKGTNTAFRIFSKPKKISTYDLIEGNFLLRTGSLLPQLIKKNIASEIRLTSFLSQ